MCFSDCSLIQTPTSIKHTYSLTYTRTYTHNESLNAEQNVTLFKRWKLCQQIILSVFSNEQKPFDLNAITPLQTHQISSHYNLSIRPQIKASHRSVNKSFTKTYMEGMIPYFVFVNENMTLPIRPWYFASSSHLVSQIPFQLGNFERFRINK